MQGSNERSVEIHNRLDTSILSCFELTPSGTLWIFVTAEDLPYPSSLELMQVQTTYRYVPEGT
jgi:hypothetical protein